jgi:3-hydroxyacyl-[acyl-carrier-protein] dehydratase
MGWCWIDRFVEFESRQYAKAVKRASLEDKLIGGNFPPYQVMPKPLVVEGLAQTAGLLVCESKGFTTAVILAKIPRAEFFCEAYAGDLLTYTATVQDIRQEGANVRTTSHIEERLHAEVEIVFAHVVTGSDGGTPFDPRFFEQMMIRLGAFDLDRKKKPAVAVDAGMLGPSESPVG